MHYIGGEKVYKTDVPNEGSYKIGEFSRLCRVSVKTLRFYDSFGLLYPDYIDKYTGYRYYSASQLRDFQRIAALKEAGFSLEEIRDNMQDVDTELAFGMLEKKRKDLVQIISDAQLKLRKLDIIKDLMGKDGNSMFDVIIREGNDIKIAAIRKIFANREEVYCEIGKIKNYLKENCVSTENVSVITNYEIEHTEENLDYEVGVAFTDALPKCSPYYEKTLNVQGKTACVVCELHEIDTAYSSLQYSIGRNGYQIVGAFYEFHYGEGTVEIKVPVWNTNDHTGQTRCDDINLPFENDDEVIGRWEVIDCLPTKEHFNPKKLKYSGSRNLNELYFLHGGERYWLYGWTKNYVINTNGDGQWLQKYELFEENGERYMFLEYRKYMACEAKSEYYVLRKTDSKCYSRNEIRIYDDTNYPFINDGAVLGKWIVAGYSKDIDSFNPKEGGMFPYEKLFYKYADFKLGGEFEKQIGNRIISGKHTTWTKGLVLEHNRQIASAYTIKRIEGADYLFIEWKSGDYIFGGRKPGYYAFVRSE